MLEWRAVCAESRTYGSQGGWAKRGWYRQLPRPQPNLLSFRDVEDLLAERGITLSYETVRQRCKNFGPQYARRIKKRQGPRGDRWFLDEVVVNIQGKRRYLWRAVDQDGDLIDILVQKRKDTRAAKRFLSQIAAVSNRSADRDNHGQASQLRRRQA
jgi:transposase-like protein